MRARGRRKGWLCLLAVAALALVPPSAALASVGLDAPLIGPQEVDVGLANDGLGVSVDSSILPTAKLDLPLIEAVAGPGSGSPRSAPPPPAVPPAPTPPDLPAAVAGATGSAAGAVAIGIAVAAPGMPWEGPWSAVSNWMAQVRESLRPAGRAVGRFLKALPFLVPLFSRVAPERLLENPVRARVHEAVSSDPGLSLQDVRDRSGIAWGTTVHHLARLERAGYLVSVRHGNHRRFFPANTPVSRSRRELSVLAHPTAHRVAAHVLAEPGTDQKSLCAALGLNNPAASKHLSRMERLGLVSVETVGRSRLYQPTDLLRTTLATMDTLGGVRPGPAQVEPAPVPAPVPRAPLREMAVERSPLMSPDVALAT